MEMRIFGRTGMPISVLGFGCGAVGGLMVRGDLRDQERAIGRAIEVGVNYFDTAVQYGNGVSEENLGRILKKLKPANVIVGTKVRLLGSDRRDFAHAIRKSVEGSLKRIGMEQVDVFYLHDQITLSGDAEALSVEEVLEQVAPLFEALRQEGKARFLGLTAVGETEALHEVIDTQVFDAAQVTYNLLNSSAAKTLPSSYPAQDYGRLLDRTQAAGVGVVAIRVLAGGALSGVFERHPIASPPPAPIGSAYSYEADLARARRLAPLVQEGFATSLHEAAIRFALSHSAVSSILVGMASPDEFEQALRAVQRGPLPQAALDRVYELQQMFAGEAR
jgi:aryl-alcohol dehydrogenase-like predicted oxidoreductase